MPANPLEKRQAKQLSAGLPRTKKIAVVVLAAAAILVFVFWIIQIKQQLARPFKVEDETIASQLGAEVDSRQTDTDGDGLSDYDETNTYQTSPYLEDTDSDGLTDSAEISNGTDPTCPAGKNCQGSEMTTVSSTTADDSFEVTTLGDISASDIDSALLQSAMDGQIDAATLRQILISSGVDKNLLDQISDEDLMKSYQDTLRDQSSATTVQNE